MRLNVEKRPGESSWVRYIKRRIQRNKNFLGIFVGPTGSGKSWSALAVAEMLDDSFNIDRVVFKAKDLMSEIKKHEKGRKGLVFIWEEAGIDLSSRNWQSLVNKMINYLLQTFRHRCFILLFTVPYEDFVDIQTRKLLHAEFKTMNIDEQTEKVKMKPKLYQYNPDLKKFYKKYLKVKAKSGVMPVKIWNVPKPSEELIEVYEKKKKGFTDELNNKITMQLEKFEEKEKQEMKPKYKQPLTELQQHIVEMREEKKYNNLKEFGEELARRLGRKHIKQPQISMNVRFIRNKGYDLPNIT